MSDLEQELKDKVHATITDLEALYRKVEVAIHAHDQGQDTFDPAHLAGIRDDLSATIDNAKNIVAEPVGSPVPPGPPSGQVAKEAPVDTDAGTGDGTQS